MLSARYAPLLLQAFLCAGMSENPSLSAITLQPFQNIFFCSSMLIERDPQQEVVLRLAQDQAAEVIRPNMMYASPARKLAYSVRKWVGKPLHLRQRTAESGGNHFL